MRQDNIIDYLILPWEAIEYQSSPWGMIKYNIFYHVRLGMIEYSEGCEHSHSAQRSTNIVSKQIQKRNGKQARRAKSSHNNQKGFGRKSSSLVCQPKKNIINKTSQHNNWPLQGAQGKTSTAPQKLRVHTNTGAPVMKSICPSLPSTSSEVSAVHWPQYAQWQHRTKPILFVWSHAFIFPKDETRVQSVQF